MKKPDYTVETGKSFADAVSAVERISAEKGFRVLHTHDVAATLTERGFPREPLKIVEICNARYASQALEHNIKSSLMLPCPITVYTQGGKTFISTLLPSTMIELLPGAGLDEVANAVEKTVLEIVDAAR